MTKIILSLLKIQISHKMDKILVIFSKHLTISSTILILYYKQECLHNSRISTTNIRVLSQCSKILIMILFNDFFIASPSLVYSTPPIAPRSGVSSLVKTYSQRSCIFSSLMSRMISFDWDTFRVTSRKYFAKRTGISCG